MQLREVIAWGSYDLANTIFSALFVTFFFPFYIKNFLGGNELEIGLVFGISMLLVALVVPILGAISDKLKRRMPFVIFFTIISCIFTFLVVFSGLYAALLFGLIANFCYHAALTMYHAILPRISTKSNIGTVSGIGVAMGYIGTMVSLIVAYPILRVIGWETLAGTKAMILTTAILFFVFSLAIFFLIKEKRYAKPHLIKEHVISSLKDVKNTFAKLKAQKGLMPFLLSLIFYNDAINAVIIFLFLFGREVIGLSVQKFFFVYAVFAAAAAIGSFFSGKIVDKIGSKKVLIAAGFLWVIVIILLLKINNLTHFIAIGSFGGVALGMTATASRPKLVELAPKDKVGEFFGFFELTDKFSGVLGPIIFGYLVVAHGYPIALLSLIVFFIIGLFFLYAVPNINVNNTPV
ncbi:MFS transporter [Candidatus Woesearchaeota archaeon]|nr:MFS transporter [Candidatus Woesearchaeota archaeon]